MHIKSYKLFEESLTKAVESKKVIVDVYHSDDNIIQNLVNNLTFVIKKRVLRNLRIEKIEGDLEKLAISDLAYSYLVITMSNKDVIKGEFTIYTDNTRNIKITINSDLVFDLDYNEYTTAIMIQKIIECYVEQLTKNNWKIKNESLNEAKQSEYIGNIMFHATTRKNLKSILNNGLIPLELNHVLSSSGEVHQDRIFLSIFKEFEQMNLPEYKLDEDLVLLQIDITELDKKLMYPDDILYWAYFDDTISDEDLETIFPRLYKKYIEEDEYDSFGEYINDLGMTDIKLESYLKGKYYLTLPDSGLDLGVMTGEIAYKGIIKKEFIKIYEN